MIWITKATYKRDFKIEITFNKGGPYLVDLSKFLEGEVFSKIKNKKKFKQFRLDSETDTICWPDGADFAPEFLFEVAQKQNPVAVRPTSRGRSKERQ